ncbi:hypothetical protein FACS189499_10010 [Clostridia bacterium]|nr:hypothetical protein FACS189499_10010 [Clostridia bacterium]
MEQAKEREKKVMITDIAVEKVGKAEIPGFSDTQNRRLQQLHRDLLQTAKNQNDSNEVLKIWNIFTDEVADTLGSESRVDLSDNPSAVALLRNSKARELVYLHNHPSTKNFSLSDIDTFVCDSQVGIMTVVTNQGEVYALKKNGRYSFIEAKNMLTEILKELHADNNYSHAEVVRKFLKESRKVGIDYVG